MTKDATNFASNLERIMDVRSISAAKLSRDSGLTSAAISQILSGKRLPNLQSTIKIARALKVSIDDLVGLPFTDPCFRCGADATNTWNICADDNQERYICDACDIELNETVLKFMEFDNWPEKMAEYKESKAANQNIRS